jgi:murein DD-endopeptidase MepM/ murein hydrolase activator NlpD
VRFYTVEIVPDHGGSRRSITLSLPFILALGLLGGGLCAAGLYLPYLYSERLLQEETVRELRARNESLVASLHDVDLRMTDLRDRLDTYEQRARRLAWLGGLEDEEAVFLDGSGGSYPPVIAGGGMIPFHAELEALDQRSRGLARSFDAIEAAYSERQSQPQPEEPALVPAYMPVPGGVLGSRFGWRPDPFTGLRDFHHGQDIIARQGTPVRATAPGIVLRAERFGGLGLAVVLSHGEGLLTRYGHMSALSVQRGDIVEQGQVIGLVGSTGRSRGSHLHYEVHIGGEPVDPAPFIGSDEPAAVGTANDGTGAPDILPALDPGA